MRYAPSNAVTFVQVGFLVVCAAAVLYDLWRGRRR